MRTDMTKVVLHGGNSGKYRPFHDRKVEVLRERRTPEPTRRFYLDDGDYVDVQDEPVYLGRAPRNVGFEPMDVGRIPMRPRQRLWDRADNLTFAPMRRWLATQVNRPWDEVYSEASRKFLPALGRSVREFLASDVSTNCYRVDDGTLVFNSDYGGVREATWNDYYVEPETGMLRASNRRARNRTVSKEVRAERDAERAKVFRQGPGDIQYHKRDGVWYEVHLGSYKAEAARQEKLSWWLRKPIVDSFLKRGRFCLSSASRQLYGKEDYYAVSHRAIGRREAHRLGLD